MTAVLAPEALVRPNHELVEIQFYVAVSSTRASSQQKEITTTVRSPISKRMATKKAEY